MQEKTANGVLIIPALNPEKSFVGLAKQMTKYFTDIIVVDDGSTQETKVIFQELKAVLGKRLHLLTHEINLGKGEAIKTAVRYYKSSSLCERYCGVLTADCDGQHLPEDCMKVDKALGKNHEKALHIGYRDLSSGLMPLRSKFGNKSTVWLFSMLYGIKLKDTQSGLRAFSGDILDWLISVKGSRFEYEMNVLIESKNAGVCIYETPITTRYEINHKSHFRTGRDSLKVLKVLFAGLYKFMLAALAAAGVDLGGFALIYYVLCPESMDVATALLLSTVISRLLSSLVNFLFNRYVTFGGKAVARSSILKYYALWLVQMGGSYAAVLGLTTLFGGAEMLIKLVVDLVLATIGYQIQLRWVFKKKQVRE